MGKDSLIKSTTKKTAKKSSSQKKTTHAKTGSQGKKKSTASRAKGTKRRTATSTAKSTPKKLLFKQFVSRKSPSPPPPPDYSAMTAPPLIDSKDAAEAARLRELLSRRFDMADIKAAAEAVIERAVAESETPSSPAPAPAAETRTPAPAPLEAEIQAQGSETGIGQPQTPPASTAPSEAKPIEAAQERPQKRDSGAEQTASAHPQSLSDSGPASGHLETSRREADPVQRALKLGLAALSLIILLVVWASVSNSLKYFVFPTNGSVEIWRGDFSPAGKRFVAVLHGVQLDAPAKSVYRRDEIYPILFTYYLNKADSFLDVEGLPDYQSINDYLQRADKFALNREMRNAVDARRNHIQRLSLLYKADVEAGKGTQASFQSALQSLMEAKRLTKDLAQLQIIDQRIGQVRESLAKIKNGAQTPAGPEKAK